MLEDDDEVGSLKDFIDDGDVSDFTSTSDTGQSGNDSEPEVLDEVKGGKKKKQLSTRSQIKDKGDLVSGLDEVKEEALASEKGWWNQFLDQETDLERVELGSKMVLLMDILRECEMVGDKVLVFSQSLLSLDLIEAFLEKVDHDNSQMSSQGEASMLL